MYKNSDVLPVNVRYEISYTYLYVYMYSYPAGYMVHVVYEYSYMYMCTCIAMSTYMYTLCNTLVLVRRFNFKGLILLVRRTSIIRVRVYSCTRVSIFLIRRKRDIIKKCSTAVSWIVAHPGQQIQSVHACPTSILQT